jgi:hypothetical protein
LCRLLQNAQRGAITVNDALARIADARAQVEQVKVRLAPMEARPVRLPLAERVADAVASAASGPRASRRAAELEAAMAALAGTIRTTFLG